MTLHGFGPSALARTTGPREARHTVETAEGLEKRSMQAIPLTATTRRWTARGHTRRFGPRTAVALSLLVITFALTGCLSSGTAT